MICDYSEELQRVSNKTSNCEKLPTLSMPLDRSKPERQTEAWMASGQARSFVLDASAAGKRWSMPRR